MSTVTAVRKGNEICIASETLTTLGNTKMQGEFIDNSEKILKWGNSYIGIVGDVAVSMMISDVIRKAKKKPSFSDVNSIYMYFTKLHRTLKDKYFLNAEEHDDDPAESSQLEVIIVNKHGIFGVHSLREVYSFNKFWAYGSGRKYALGAMYSLYDQKNIDAEKIAKAGVAAGVTFDTGSYGKIISYKMKV